MRWWLSCWRVVGVWPWFAPVVRRLTVADRWVSRVTRGRLVALGMARALLLTTVGRRTGRQRRSPLLYVRDGAGYVVVGSNGGAAVDPGWVHNLLAQPRAVVTVGGRHIHVVAWEVTGDERERLWDLLVTAWPAFGGYRTRAAGRVLRVFRLVPV